MGNGDFERTDSSVELHPKTGDNLVSLLREIRDRLPSAGGGSTYDGMERVAKLEARADMTDQRLGRIEDKLDRILEKVGAQPTTNGLWGMVAAVLGVGLAISGLTFVIAEWVKP